MSRLGAIVRSRPARVVGALLGLALFVLLLLRLRALWREEPVPLDAASVPLLGLALVASLVA